jgi:hypothetical protein
VVSVLPRVCVLKAAYVSSLDRKVPIKASKQRIFMRQWYMSTKKKNRNMIMSSHPSFLKYSLINLHTLGPTLGSYPSYVLYSYYAAATPSSSCDVEVTESDICQGSCDHHTGHLPGQDSRSGTLGRSPRHKSSRLRKS